MKKYLKAFWKMCRSNLVLKIMAVLFAVVLWSFVLSATNPPREREIRDVAVQWLGIDSLKEKGLAIAGDLADILNEVDVKVRVNQNDIKLLNSSSASATVDLSKINGVGLHTLPVRVDTSYQKLEVKPSVVEVYVDQRVTVNVPINVKTTGSVASGYYADTPTISPNVISITGARSEVTKVKSALCAIDLTGLEEGYRKTEEVTLLDESGEAVDPRIFSESVTSVVVDLAVLPVKTVSVDVLGSMIGSPAPGYEISAITVSPETIRIVGARELLNKIDTMPLIPFSVAGISLDTVMPVGYAPPEGVRVLGPDKAEVTISIREITQKEDYKNVEIDLRNLSKLYKATAEPGSVDVTVIAGVAKLSKLLRKDIVPYVDLDGLEPGEYTLSVKFELPEGFSAENFIPDSSTVKVVISRK